MIAHDVIGVDIAKGWIDTFHLASSRHERIATTKSALASFARAARGALVVLEASGGYERPVTGALAKAGVGYARVNPRQAREFARATGRLAKTDRVDAAVLARMGRALELAPTPPEDPDRARLSDLVARREDLTTTIRREKNRAGTTRDAWIAREIAMLVRVLEAHLKTVETAIAALIETRDRLAAEARRLRSVPGIGPAVSAVLLARLPELGSLDHRRIASLAGLAPQACDSGLHRGKRRIWGGRPDVRRALYLAGFIASRCDPTIKAFRTRLEAAGKLLTILNAMIRHKQDYTKHAT
jgi:transposase